MSVLPTVLHRIDDLEKQCMAQIQDIEVLHRIDDLERMQGKRGEIKKVLHRIDDLENIPAFSFL